ncbi:MAG: thiamine phosphate synthase [Pseudomonadota bacterium]
MWRAALTLGAARRSGKALPPLLFFTDPVRTPRPERTIALLPRGAGVVFRAFGASDAEAQGRSLARQARRRGLVFLVGADAGLAVRLAADGVHLPQSLARRAGAIRALHRRFLVTAAAHDLPAALAAGRAGVDAIVVSPIFPSASPSAGRPLGPRALAVLARRAGLPTYALGGVDAVTVRGLKHAGAVGVAAIGGLIG